MSNERQRALRAAFALIGALAISACGSARYPTYYTLHLAPSTQAQALDRDIGTLAIEELGCPDYLCEGRIVYRPTPTEIGFYQYHRWASNPRTMIAQYLAERVEARSLFTSVSDNQSRRPADFLLTGTLEQLEEVDDGRQVTAICTMSAQLVRTRGGVVLWSGTAAERVPVQQRDMTGVVNGLTTAARNTVDRLLADMELELERGNARRDLP